MGPICAKWFDIHCRRGQPPLLNRRYRGATTAVAYPRSGREYKVMLDSDVDAERLLRFRTEWVKTEICGVRWRISKASRLFYSASLCHAAGAPGKQLTTTTNTKRTTAFPTRLVKLSTKDEMLRRPLSTKISHTTPFVEEKKLPKLSYGVELYVFRSFF